MGTKADIATLLEPIFDALPAEVAMPELVPSASANGGEGSYEDPRRTAHEIVTHVRDSLAGMPELEAVLWLYVDDLVRSHGVSQGIASQLGSYLHAVMHRREGDFSNSKYWLRRAGFIPDGMAGFDPFAFVDAVESDAGANEESLLKRQREEWKALYRMALGDLR